jgi:type VI secretion system secreted protein VgrG
MKPKSGKKVPSVKPAAPAVALDADDAVPGEIAKAKAKQRQEQAGKYGSTPSKPFKPASAEDAEEQPLGWIEIEMIGEDGSPIAGERYEVKLPDGSVSTGTLDGNGLARIEGFEPGNCEISFPDLDQDAWEKA